MNPPIHKSEYIKESVYRAVYRSFPRESSRKEPAQFMNVSPGMWKIDNDYLGPHGYEIEELRLLDPYDLVAGEVTEERRFADVKRYARWITEGLEPPPISVVETAAGELRIYNGHRRWLAAQRAGAKILAWVNPVAFVEGKPVGLTFELALELNRPPLWKRVWGWVKRLFGRE